MERDGSDGSSASASFHGLVADQYDAALLVTAARLGFIPRFRRRLDIVEQRAFIRSGSVFLWNEEESYMKRWTDGYPWSPSRVQNKFLVYREMAKRGGARSRTAARLLGHSPDSSADSPRRKYIRNLASSLFNRGELEYLDMYSNSGYSRPDDIFRRGGLVKKTFTITLPKETWHVVAYYTLEDILDGRLTAPSENPTLRHPRILSDVADVFEGTSRPIFEANATLRMLTPLPWTTPFLEHAGTKESPEYHPGIADLTSPQISSSSPSSSSSSSSTSSPVSLPFPPLPGVSTSSTQTGIVTGPELEPDSDRDISVVSSSFSSSSDSIGLHSGSSWSTEYSPCSQHYSHLPSHHHHQHHQQEQQHQHQLPLNNDPNSTTEDPSPVVVFPSQPLMDYGEAYADVEDIHVNVYNGQYYYTFHDHNQPHSYYYPDSAAYSAAYY